MADLVVKKANILVSRHRQQTAAGRTQTRKPKTSGLVYVIDETTWTKAGKKHLSQYVLILSIWNWFKARDKDAEQKKLSVSDVAVTVR